MNYRPVFVSIVGFVALSLIGSPITMADWSERADFYVQNVEESEVDEEVPVLYYENLSTPAQHAVQQTIDSSDNTHAVYGREDWPDEFAYTDEADPGEGLHAIIYEGQYYLLFTGATGGPFFIIILLLELPFIIYGFVLGWVASSLSLGDISIRTASFATAPGIVFHLLGPEFDFPLLTPYEYAALGLLTTIVVVIKTYLGHYSGDG